jgi:hypothetical protein
MLVLGFSLALAIVLLLCQENSHWMVSFPLGAAPVHLPSTDMDGKGPSTTLTRASRVRRVIGGMISLAGRNRISRHWCPGSEVIARGTETQEGSNLAGLTRLARSRAPLHRQLGIRAKAPQGSEGLCTARRKKPRCTRSGRLAPNWPRRLHDARIALSKLAPDAQPQPVAPLPILKLLLRQRC